MKAEIYKLFRHGSVYAIGMILSKLVSFIMIPIYTRYLVPSEYGTIEILDMSVDLFSILIGGGLAAAIFRFYYNYSDDKDRKKVIGTAFTIVLLSFLAGFILLYSFAPIISKIIFEIQNHNYAYYLKIMSITMFLTAGIEIPMAYLRIQNKSGKFVLLSLSRLIMQLNLNIYFLVLLKMGVVGVLYSSLITSFIMSTYLCISTFRAIGFNFSNKMAKELIWYGYPLVISMLAGFALNFSDRFFLNHFANLEQVGIYSLGYKFGWIISLLILSPFEKIWTPQKFEIAKQDNAKEIYSRVFTILNILIITTGGFVCVVIKEIVTIIADQAYWNCYSIVPLIIVAYLIHSWNQYTNIGVHLKYKTKYLAYVTVFAAVAVLLFNYLLIPIWGAYGAAYATIFAFFIRFFVIYCISIKLFPIKYEWFRILSLLLLTAVLTFFISFITTPWLLLTISIKILSFFVIYFLLVLIIAVKQEERKIIIQIIKKPNQWYGQFVKLRQAI